MCSLQGEQSDSEVTVAEPQKALQEKDSKLETLRAKVSYSYNLNCIFIDNFPLLSGERIRKGTDRDTAEPRGDGEQDCMLCSIFITLCP